MESKDTHFSKIYLFVCCTAIIVLLYVVAITFFPIPKENQRFVDISLAFLLGFISNNDAYLTGGNPAPQKKLDTPTAGTTTTANIEVTQTKEQEPEADPKLAAMPTLKINE